MDKQNKQSVICPECDNPINVTREIKQGMIIECLACGGECEFLTINPVQLAPLEEEK